MTSNGFYRIILNFIYNTILEFYSVIIIIVKAKNLLNKL
jgi:hypothetical protein